jgi:hypothetical protein
MRDESATNTVTQLTTRVVTTIREIESLRSAWTSFSGHRDSDIDFYLEQLQTSPNTLRPHVIVLCRGNLPQALLPGRMDRTTFGQRLGYLKTPSVASRALLFGDFRGEQTKENCELVIKSLLASLRDDEADYALIPTISHSEAFRAALALPNLWCRDHAPEFLPNHILRISGEYADVFAQLSRNLREQIQRKKKKMAAAFDGRVEFICYTRPADLATMLPEIESVAKNSYQRGIGVGFVNDDSMRRSLNFLAVKGWLRIFVAYLDGKPAAFSIGTILNKTYTSDFLGYDPQFGIYSVGTVLQSVLIERCCKEGVEVVDFSMGYADYKKRFGNDSISVSRVYIFAPHIKGIYLNGMRTATAHANKFGKRLLAKTGLLMKMKKGWRSGAATRPSLDPQLHQS